jgi:hypothetical protein
MIMSGERMLSCGTLTECRVPQFEFTCCRTPARSVYYMHLPPVFTVQCMPTVRYAAFWWRPNHCRVHHDHVMIKTDRYLK